MPHVAHSASDGSGLAKFEQATWTGQFDERFRILCTHGEVRWIKVHWFPVRDRSGNILRLIGTAQEITAQKAAEDQVARNLAKAESAWAEADALRKATLALTQDLDFVLDALLRSLAELVPYSCARVLVPEGGSHWLTLGERLCPEPADKSYRYPVTLIADKSPFLPRISIRQKSVLIPDTGLDEGWNAFKGHKQFRSWLCVPLVASQEFLKFLSAGHSDPNVYTQDHLRRAELLVIPAPRQSRMLVCNRPPKFTVKNWKNELPISSMQKALWRQRRAAEGCRRGSFRRSFVPAQFPSPSQR